MKALVAAWVVLQVDCVAVCAVRRACMTAGPHTQPMYQRHFHTRCSGCVASAPSSGRAQEHSTPQHPVPTSFGALCLMG
jgi:hypothetical protein